jgi:hypothetical protein
VEIFKNLAEALSWLAKDLQEIDILKQFAEKARQIIVLNVCCAALCKNQ